MSEIRQPLGSLKLTEINTARRELLDLSKKVCQILSRFNIRIKQQKKKIWFKTIRMQKHQRRFQSVCWKIDLIDKQDQLLQQNADLKKKYGLLEKENALLKQSIIQQNEKLKNLDTSVYEFSNLYHVGLIYKFVTSL